MKTTYFTIRILFVFVFMCITGIQMNAQSGSRVILKFSALQCYQKEEPEPGYGKYIGVNDPQGGFSSILLFEKDINKLFKWSTGLLYEIRKNSYAYVTDTTYSVPMGDGPFPYKFTSNSTYKFIGIPIYLGVNYLNHPNFKIYQNFGFHFTYLLSAKKEGDIYYRQGVPKKHGSGDFSDSRTNIIISFSSSIGIRQRIFKNISLEIQPGLNYMVNNCTDDERFFDIKLDAGIVLDL